MEGVLRFVLTAASILAGVAFLVAVNYPYALNWIP
jgi:hypothetical protein